MVWIPIKERLPDPLVRVWVLTDSGKQTTARIDRDGNWHLFCRRVADTNPQIVSWSE